MIKPECQVAVGVKGLTPYAPGKPISDLERELGITGIVKLASNENPLGPSPKALSAIAEVLGELALYPDGSGFELKRVLSVGLGLESSQISLGNGSNDVLEIIARTFLEPGYNAVYAQHAFAVYPLATQVTGAEGRVAPAHDGSRGPRYGHDLDAILSLCDKQTRLVFLANPNNPTGTYLKTAELRAFLERLPSSIVVVVDEAYFEYVELDDYPDASKWLTDFPNLVVTRTFSKAFGLAGLRVGYALSSAVLAEFFNRVRQPFNVNSLAFAAAIAAWNDKEHLTRSREANRLGLAQLASYFDYRGLSYIPTVGNFVTVDLQRPAQPIYDALLRGGIIVRPVANYGLPTHLRVTVGTAEQNTRFAAVLDQVLGA